MTETVGNPSGTLGADDRGHHVVDLLIVGAGPGGPLRRLLRRLPRALGRRRRLAARAGRPDHRDVPREGDPRRRRLPGRQGQRPRRGAGRAGGDRQADVPPRPHRGDPGRRRGGGEVSVGLDDGTDVVAGAVIITAGIGKFTPRPLPAGEGWDGRRPGVLRARPSRSTPARTSSSSAAATAPSTGRSHLEPVAASVTLVHRRDAVPRPPAHRRPRSEAGESRSSPRPR